MSKDDYILQEIKGDGFPPGMLLKRDNMNEETPQNNTEVKEEEKMNDEERLNLKQEEFCQLYATEEEFFGNGVETYLEVYEIDKTKPNWYKTACSAASRLLRNGKVCQRINTLLEEGGLNDQFVDKQLVFLITQHSDFTNKLGAIKEYNKLKQRITDKLEHSGGLVIQIEKELAEKYNAQPSPENNSTGQAQI